MGTTMNMKAAIVTACGQPLVIADRDVLTPDKGRCR